MLVGLESCVEIELVMCLFVWSQDSCYYLMRVHAILKDNIITMFYLIIAVPYVYNPTSYLYHCLYTSIIVIRDSFNDLKHCIISLFRDCIIRVVV